MTTIQYEAKHGHAIGACCLLGRCGREAMTDAWTVTHAEKQSAFDVAQQNLRDEAVKTFDKGGEQ